MNLKDDIFLLKSLNDPNKIHAFTVSFDVLLIEVVDSSIEIAATSFACHTPKLFIEIVKLIADKTQVLTDTRRIWSFYFSYNIRNSVFCKLAANSFSNEIRSNI